jgi:hypothetical protein
LTGALATLPSHDPDAPSGAAHAAPLSIHFVHAAATPHNSYLLDTLAAMPEVVLHRHYLLTAKAVPGRPWKTMGEGSVQPERIRSGIGTRFDGELLRLALTDRNSAWFVVGWDFPLLVWLIALLGLLKRPLIMWDDGPSPESLAAFSRWWSPRQLVKRALIALINRTGGTYFCTGEAVIGDVRRMGVKSGRLRSLPFFVPAGARDDALRAEHRCGAGCVLIVAGGRLVPEKGFDVFVEALGILAETAPDGWRAVLIGSGPEGDGLTARANKLDLDAKLDLVAWAEPERFAAYMHTCDVFVAPARFDHFPTTVIAALQAGAAVVATRAVGSAAEFIDSGESGEIVPPGDPAALAAALRLLVEDPARRARMAQAGHAAIAEWPVERGAQMIADAAREAVRCAG